MYKANMKEPQVNITTLINNFIFCICLLSGSGVSVFIIHGPRTQ